MTIDSTDIPCDEPFDVPAEPPLADDDVLPEGLRDPKDPTKPLRPSRTEIRHDLEDGAKIPFDPAAEAAVLGAAMGNPGVCGRVVGSLRPEDIWDPKHKVVFRELAAAFAANEPTDANIIAERLVRAGRPQGTLTFDMWQAGATGDPAYWLGRVKDATVLRSTAQAAIRAYQKAVAPNAHPDLVRDDLLKAAVELNDVGTVKGGPVRGEELSARFMDSFELDTRPKPITTGIHDLDCRLGGGPRAGQLVVIAARPGVGKSALAANMAYAQAIAGYGVLFVSLEMGESEVVDRLVALGSRVDHSKVEDREMTNAELARVTGVAGKIGESKLAIADDAQATVARIHGWATGLKARGELDIVYVDYLQLMKTGPGAESRQQAVAEMSRSLKLMAKELGVPVVALSQLNREVEHRADPTPQLSDLRESGAVEQDADTIIFMSRDDVVEREHPRAGLVDLTVAKNRGGPTGKVTAAFLPHYQQVVDLDHDAKAQDAARRAAATERTRAPRRPNVAGLRSVD